MSDRYRDSGESESAQDAARAAGLGRVAAYARHASPLEDVDRIRALGTRRNRRRRIGVVAGSGMLTLGVVGLALAITTTHPASAPTNFGPAAASVASKTAPTGDPCALGGVCQPTTDRPTSDPCALAGVCEPTSHDPSGDPCGLGGQCQPTTDASRSGS